MNSGPDSTETADRLLAGEQSPVFFDIGGIRAVTIERKRRVSTDWGKTPLLAERKTLKAIWIPIGGKDD